MLASFTFKRGSGYRAVGRFACLVAAVALVAMVLPLSAGAQIPGADDYGPADGRWYETEDGRRYFLQPMPLKQNGRATEGWFWRWADDKEGQVVRIRYGLEFEVESQDDENLYLRFYELEERKGPTPRKKGFTLQEKEAAAATFEVPWEEVDRLVLEQVDAGLPTTGQWRQGFVVVDMDADGHLDIVHGPARKATPLPNVFLGDGNGTFRFWNEARYGRFPYDYGDVAVADFNSDGHHDLALGMHLKGIAVLFGDGKGNFALSSEGIGREIPGAGGAAQTFSSRAIDVVDWNKDGLLDVLALGEGAKGMGRIQEGDAPDTKSARGVLVFLNDGDGTWTETVAAADSIFGNDVAVADFDLDGHLDFFVGSGQLGRIDLLFLGQEDGTTTSTVVEPLRPAAIIRGVAAEDLDRDGRPDLVLAYQARDAGQWYSGLDLLWNDPEGWVRSPLSAVRGMVGAYDAAVGDLDGDGNLDVVGTTGDGTIWTLLGLGERRFLFEQTPELGSRAPNCHAYATELADLDADGLDEIVITFAGEGSYAMGTPFPGCDDGGSMEVWEVPARRGEQPAP